MEDRERHGRTAKGVNHYAARLNEADVVEARRLYAIGWTKVALAERFGVSDVAIGHVVRRTTWAHVP